jgi:hypothetical protein
MASDSTGKAPVQAEVHPGPSKGLLLLVKVLGVIMVLLFVALIVGIILKAQNSKVAPPVNVVMELGIDPASIRHLALDGGNLAIATDKELIVVDVKQRKVTLRSFKP